jgi:hypothetical protein
MGEKRITMKIANPSDNFILYNRVHIENIQTSRQTFGVFSGFSRRFLSIIQDPQ